ncbi:MAG: replicative DNA helicase [Treponemataceae bacterium]|nr:MAG: replicative DNA helicase [Treponemataceae bacterium]
MAYNEKLPPHNLEAEQATLGSLLIDWSMADVAFSELHLLGDQFYNRRNTLIFEALLSLHIKHDVADTLSLTEELRQKGTLDEAGGVAYVAQLTDVVPTSSNIRYYVGVVQDLAVKRKLIKASSEIIGDSHDETRRSDDVLDEAEKRIFSIRDAKQNQEIYNMEIMISEASDTLELRKKNKGGLTGIPSGFADIDAKTNGFKDEEFIIIGARPSIGKTALAISMARHIAVEKSIPCAFFSLEMPHSAIAMRLIAQEAHVDAMRLQDGMLSVQDGRMIVDACGKLYESPLFVVDTPNMRMLDLRAVARRIVAKHGAKIIFIDYISLIKNEDTRIPRYEQVSEISRSLKALARELKVPIIALSQLRREAEATGRGHANAVPNLADIRESGSIEQDADVVMFIHRDRKKQNDEDEENKSRDTIETKLIIAKNRNGPIGDVELMFIPKYTNFESVERQK